MGNPLEQLSALADFEMLRPELEDILVKKDCKSTAGRPNWWSVSTITIKRKGKHFKFLVAQVAGAALNNFQQDDADKELLHNFATAYKGRRWNSTLLYASRTSTAETIVLAT